MLIKMFGMFGGDPTTGAGSAEERRRGEPFRTAVRGDHALPACAVPLLQVFF